MIYGKRGEYMADSKPKAAQGSTADQATADTAAAQRVQAAAAAGEVDLQPSETIPGGKYYMQRGRERWLINANGQRIDENGKVLEGQ
jgi:hypothetical protein